jgi:hypothetical protein
VAVRMAIVVVVVVMSSDRVRSEREQNVAMHSGSVGMPMDMASMPVGDARIHGASR